MQRQTFRDSIGTINQKGERVWVFPKKVKGFFYTQRTRLSWLLLFCLVVAPFVKVDNNQLFLFDILERKFSFFGITFFPQDFHLIVLSMIIGVVFIIVFTVIYGRIFCGWVCPQTIFMEMVFRKIEYWIEGDRGSQIRLDKQAWNAEKIRKKILKWNVFFLISFLISNIFLAYIIGSDNLQKLIVEGIAKHLGTFIALLIFTVVFFFVFAWFREQVCIIVCPYGRLQGVLLDDKTINVAYDYKRGEGRAGRAKFRKNQNREDKGQGDCIDCNQCVVVCPTGIDIRNGTQLECVNCTACIDVCDEVMDKVGFSRGLIRYASEDNISKGLPFEFTFRMKAYTFILAVLITILTTFIFLRKGLETTLLRLPGQLYETKQNHLISNVFTYKIVNKTSNDLQKLTFVLLSHKGNVKLVGGDYFNISKESFTEGTLFIEIHRGLLKDSREKVKIGIYSEGKLLETMKVFFMGPRKF